MSAGIKKKDLIVKLYELTKIKESEMKKASKDAQDRANEAEGAMQSRYDTFKEEGQNLAGGLKIRHKELEASLSIIKEILQEKNFPDHDNVNIYSYIEVEFEDSKKGEYFMAPVMGGEKLDENISIITPHSPIGKSLMGKEEGEEFKYFVGNVKKKGEIITLQ